MDGYSVLHRSGEGGLLHCLYVGNIGGGGGGGGLTARLYGGYPDFYSQNHKPVIGDGNRNFFCMFESRMKTPGVSVQIEVHHLRLPEVTVPLLYSMLIKDEGKLKFYIFK